MKYGERILKLRKDNNLTQKYLSEKLGISRAALAHYEKNRREPDYEILDRLANFFDVSVDYILGRVKNKKVNCNRAIPLVNFIKSSDNFLEEKNTGQYLEVPSYIEADFALLLGDDSMIWAGIHAGDTAFVKKTPAPEHGMIVAVKTKEDDSNIALRYYVHKDNKTYLEAANPEYKNIENSSHHYIVGYVVIILKKPPALQVYNQLMLGKSKEEESWQKVKEKSAFYGLNGEKVNTILDMANKLRSIKNDDSS